MAVMADHRTTLPFRYLPAFLLCAAAAALVGTARHAPAAPATQPATKPAKPDPMKPVADDPKLPRVLLIGDSISIGYTLPVREKLAGKANVHRPAANCESTLRGLKDLDKWLGDPNTAAGKWDVIHFNWGLHDLKYHDGKGTITDVDKGTQQVPADEYEKNLRELVKRLKQTGATLVWCATTPVPPGAKGRVPADVAKYNEVAAGVMKDEEVETDDLYAFAAPRLAEIQQKADVHYTAAGYDQLAGQVVSTVKKALAGRSRPGGKGDSAAGGK